MRATVTGAVWGLVLGGAGVGAASLLTDLPQNPRSESPAADLIGAGANTPQAPAVPQTASGNITPDEVVETLDAPAPTDAGSTPPAAVSELVEGPATQPSAADQITQELSQEQGTQGQPAAQASQAAEADEDIADPVETAGADSVDEDDRSLAADAAAGTPDAPASPEAMEAIDAAVATPDAPAAPEAMEAMSEDDFLAAMEGEAGADRSAQPAVAAAAQIPEPAVSDRAVTQQDPAPAPAPASVADSPAQPAAISPFAAAQADIANALQPQDSAPSADFSGGGGFSANSELPGPNSAQTDGAAPIQSELGANVTPDGLVPPVDPELDPSAALADTGAAAQQEPDAASADTGDSADDSAGEVADGSNETTAGDTTVEDGELANLPPLQRFAAPFENPRDLAVVSIVLVDDGTRSNAADMLAELPVPVTVILNPLHADVGERMAAYRAAGLEVGLQILLPAGARAQDVEVAFEAAFALVPEAVVLFSNGNDMLQTDRSATGQMLDILAQEGLGLVTVERGLSNVQRQAAAAGVNAVAVMRNVDGADSGAIGRALDRAAFRARQSSGTVVLGSISAAMMNAIDDWGRDTARDEFIVAPVSAVLIPDEADDEADDVVEDAVTDEDTTAPDDTSAIAGETPVAVTE